MKLSQKDQDHYNYLLEITEGSTILPGKNCTEAYKLLPAEYKDNYSPSQLYTLQKKTNIQFEGKVGKEDRDDNFKFQFATTTPRAPKEPETPFELKTRNLKDSVINEQDFIPFRTGKGVDIIASDLGGLMPGSSYIFKAGAGVGKTTLLNSILNDIQKNHPEGEYVSVSSEMEELDLLNESRKMNWYNNINFVLFSDHEENEYLKLIEEVFTYGYSVIVWDSFQDTVELLVSALGWQRKEAFNYMLSMIKNATKGKTKNGVKSIVLMIQQVNKSGEFVGGNALKHNTTGMCTLVNDKQKNERYMFFEKNRRNGEMQDKPLYYFLDENKEINFDVERFEQERVQEEILTKNANNLKNGASHFDSVFLNVNNDPEFQDEDEDENLFQAEEDFDEAEVVEVEED